MNKSYKIHNGETVKLQDLDPQHTAGIKNKQEIAAEYAELQDRLSHLQDKLYASRSKAVLILFQGMDCSGKDGVIDKALGSLHPQGFQAHSFKRPTEQEMLYDFIWRAHQKVPAKGQITAFNRSYYEDVLVPKVHGTASDQEIASRIKHIRHFEQLLKDSGMTIIKIFLHISKDFQLAKLNERMTDPQKRWKFDPNDLIERQRWEHYQSAYEMIFAQTGNESSPWHIVPADNRWFRNYRTLQIVVEVMEQMNLTYPDLPFQHIRVDE